MHGIRGRGVSRVLESGLPNRKWIISMGNQWDVWKVKGKDENGRHAHIQKQSLITSSNRRFLVYFRQLALNRKADRQSSGFSFGDEFGLLESSLSIACLL